MTATAEQQEVESGREGARWINKSPDAQEFASWFTDNVRVDEGLEHDRYLGGIVLIPATEKYKVVEGMGSDGPVITTRERLTYTPYAKVETRLAYFWDLMSHNSDEWLGVVEPVERRRPELAGAIGQVQESLPTGMFILPVPVGDGYTYFICSTWRVAIYEKQSYADLLSGKPAIPIRQGQGTKQVPLIKSNYAGTRTWADENALMKAETGAKGRALGFAGILVIPGSGIATAEDMLEMVPGEGAAEQQAATETAPDDAAPAKAAPEQAVDEHAALLARAREILTDLKENKPPAYEEFGRWCHQRQPAITELQSQPTAALKGVVKKLEKLQTDPVPEPAEKPAEGAAAPQDAETGEAH